MINSVWPTGVVRNKTRVSFLAFKEGLSEFIFVLLAELRTVQNYEERFKAK